MHPAPYTCVYHPTIDVYREPAYVLGDGIGYARLVGVYGDEQAIVNAARVSYAKGTKTVRDDAALVAYLMEHYHDTPFEMPVATFEFKMPIFTARQHDRHRASSKNEESGRYSEVSEEFYLPTTSRIQGQSTTNKQGSNGIPLDLAGDVVRRMSKAHAEAFAEYQWMLSVGVARETARAVLPQSTYTKFVWQTNLRMLLHYLNLRDDDHAQWEIRQYARFADAVVKTWVPNVHDAWLEYRKNALVVPESAVGRVSLTDTERPESLSKRSWAKLVKVLGAA